MHNLLYAAEIVLKSHKKSLKDILWVGGFTLDEYHFPKEKVRITLEDFMTKANEAYSCGYSKEEINIGLILVGKDFWLERQTYDSIVWWKYQEIPKIEDYREGDFPIFYKENKR